jgi:hypothetical protein
MWADLGVLNRKKVLFFEKIEENEDLLSENQPLDYD